MCAVNVLVLKSIEVKKNGESQAEYDMTLFEEESD
jgi:hypothetical protein